MAARVTCPRCRGTRKVAGGPCGLCPPAKRSKYRHVPTFVDGVRFDSAKEARRWGALRLLEGEGKICGLRRQVTFSLEANGFRLTKYVADFCYLEGGATVVEDVKSDKTKKLPLYRLKKKLMRALLGITIRET